MLYDKCIIDLGAYDGQDALMYLTQGYYVFCIEANPDNIPIINHTLAAYKTHYQILNYGITMNGKEHRPFFINYFSTWSSFNEHKGSQIASWQGAPRSGLNRKINIPTITIDQLYSQYIFSKFVDIEYLKIDIEGLDHAILKSLLSSSVRPRFISCELGQSNIVDTMLALGYNTFCVVKQHTLPNTTVNIKTINKELIGFTLGHCTSGPFGCDLSNWVDANAAKIEIDLLEKGSGKWYDLHASTISGLSLC